MQKTGCISGTEDSAEGCTVIGADAQSRPCGILFAPANGKLCFVQQTSFLQHKTTCPRAVVAREGYAPKSYSHFNNYH